MKPPEAHAASPNLELDAQGRLLEEIPCIHCGYNLRGQLPAGACPECGQRVSDSVRRHRLVFSDPRWVRGVAIGTVYLAFAIVIMGALGRSSGLFGVGVGELIQIGVEAIGLRGIWLMTRREPAVPVTADKQGLRRMLRWTATTIFLFDAMWFGLIGDLVWTSFQSLRPSQLLHGVWALTSVVAATMAILVFRYLRALAERIPEPRLLKYTPLVGKGLAAGYGAAAAMQLYVGVIGGRNLWTGLAVPADVISVFGWIAPATEGYLLLFKLCSLALLAGYWRQLRRLAARSSRMRAEKVLDAMQGGGDQRLLKRKESGSCLISGRE